MKNSLFNFSRFPADPVGLIETCGWFWPVDGLFDTPAVCGASVSECVIRLVTFPVLWVVASQESSVVVFC